MRGVVDSRGIGDEEYLAGKKYRFPARDSAEKLSDLFNNPARPNSRSLKRKDNL
jgi:hypothetical protein